MIAARDEEQTMPIATTVLRGRQLPLRAAGASGCGAAAAVDLAGAAA